MKPNTHTGFVGVGYHTIAAYRMKFIRDKGERLVDAKTKKTIFNLALQSEAVTVKKQAAHQTRHTQKYQPQNVQRYRSQTDTV